MKIDSIAANFGADIYYNENFRVVIEDHMTYLRNDPQSYYQNVTPAQAYKFEGDFFGLLDQLNQPPQFHWIIMRMNKLTSPVYSQDTITQILVPSAAVVERIRATYMNVNKIKN